MVLLLANGELQEYDSPQALMNNPDSQFASLCQELQKEQNWDALYLFATIANKDNRVAIFYITNLINLFLFFFK